MTPYTFLAETLILVGILWWSGSILRRSPSRDDVRRVRRFSIALYLTTIIVFIGALSYAFRAVSHPNPEQKALDLSTGILWGLWITAMGVPLMFLCLAALWHVARRQPASAQTGGRESSVVIPRDPSP